MHSLRRRSTVAVLSLLLVAGVLALPATAFAQTAPGAPGAELMHQTHLGFYLNWYAPPHDGGDAVARYGVQLRSKPVTCGVGGTYGTWTDQAHTGTERFLHVTGLRSGHCYQVRYRAGNSAGWGPWSTPSATNDPADTHTAVSKSPRPDPPRLLTLTAGPGKLTVTWAPPAALHGHPVTAYRVTHIHYDDNGEPVRAELRVGGSETSAELTGLEGGREYEVHVAAVTSEGTGGFSPSVSATPQPVRRAPTAKIPFTSRPRPVPGRGSGVTEPDTDPRPAIDVLGERGVLKGTGCGPDDQCADGVLTRWVAAVWMVRMIDGADPAPSVASRYADVDGSAWYAPHIERLAALGITKGCGSEPARFCPDASLTRGQAASLLVTAFKVPAAVPRRLADTVGSVHEARIDAVLAARIAKTCDTGPPRFCPSATIARAEFAEQLRAAHNRYPARR